jgi:hypothetical protein
VRVVASLIPRELEAPITPVTERMSDAQLEAIIARIEGGLDPAATDEDEQTVRRPCKRTNQSRYTPMAAATASRNTLRSLKPWETSAG